MLQILKVVGKQSAENKAKEGFEKRWAVVVSIPNVNISPASDKVLIQWSHGPFIMAVTRPVKRC